VSPREPPEPTTRRSASREAPRSASPGWSFTSHSVTWRSGKSPTADATESASSAAALGWRKDQSTPPAASKAGNDGCEGFVQACSAMTPVSRRAASSQPNTSARRDRSYLVTFFTANEQVQRDVPNVSLRQSLATLSTNRPLIMLCVSGLLFLTGMIAAVAVFVPQIVRTLGKKTGYILLGLVAVVAGVGIALAPPSTALHVKHDGPLSQRIERAARESGMSIERAAKRQKREDQVRADMSITLYGWDPRETERYDLVVNTGTMDLDTCVDIIVQAARVRAGA
jgi:hypothetical protein